jgi:hypothetical protein
MGDDGRDIEQIQYAGSRVPTHWQNVSLCCPGFFSLTDAAGGSNRFVPLGAPRAGARGYTMQGHSSPAPESAAR